MVVLPPLLSAAVTRSQLRRPALRDTWLAPACCQAPDKAPLPVPLHPVDYLAEEQLKQAGRQAGRCSVCEQGRGGMYVQGNRRESMQAS